MKPNAAQLAYLEKGLRALREKRYFDAHEEWEIPWREMQGDQKLFWQAMIQLSVGAYHYQNENLTGCRNLWGKALHKCNRILEKEGIKKLEFVGQLKSVLEACLKAVQENASPLPHVEHAAKHIISEEWFEVG